MKLTHLLFTPLIAAGLVLSNMALAEKATPEIAPYDKSRAAKIVRPKAKRLDDGSRRLLSRPAITRFTAESMTGGNNINLFSHGRLRVRISVEDSGANIDSLSFSFNGHNVHNVRPASRTYVNNDLRLDLTGAAPARSGTYNLTVRATNVVGQSRSRTISMAVDLERPRITSVTPADGATVFADVSTANITFEVSATDDRGIAKVQVVEDRIHDPSWQGEDRTSPYRITIRGVEEGTWDWTIGAIDNQGNMAQARRTIQVRRRPLVRP